ncbi:MAG: hypothetical protein AAB830_01540 [Patescibacteria group bacterium]
MYIFAKIVLVFVAIVLTVFMLGYLLVMSGFSAPVYADPTIKEYAQMIAWTIIVTLSWYAAFRLPRK